MQEEKLQELQDNSSSYSVHISCFKKNSKRHKKLSVALKQVQGQLLNKTEHLAIYLRREVNQKTLSVDGKFSLGTNLKKIVNFLLNFIAEIQSFVILFLLFFISNAINHYHISFEM